MHLDQKIVQSIVKPLETHADKWAFYSLITNSHNAKLWKTIKINKKKRVPIYCMPYSSLEDHSCLLDLLRATKKKNLAVAYQRYFGALSFQIEQYQKLCTLTTNKQPTEQINQLCLHTATEQMVRALQQELEPELKIINVTL